ncbi:MAG: chaperone NapD [Deltaproteobacteria bacterium]|nr:chaperone NapD [Deltaproteobacteria bacterium]
MNISGVIVFTKSGEVDAVASRLGEMEGVEVYEAFPREGKIIVLMEGENTQKEVKKFKEIHNVPGVLSVTMAYHHFEDEAEKRAAGSANEKLENLVP